MAIMGMKSFMGATAGGATPLRPLHPKRIAEPAVTPRTDREQRRLVSASTSLTRLADGQSEHVGAGAVGDREPRRDAVAFPEVVRLLIDNGADIKTRITWRGGRSGIWIVGNDATALHYAAEDGVPETIKLLIDSGVDIFATAHEFSESVGTQTALDVAAYFGKADNARAILDHPKLHQADAALRQEVLDRSLGIAAQCSWLPASTNDRRPELIVALLEHGADPRIKRFEATTVQLAALAIDPGNPEQNEIIRKIVTALVSRGAEFDMFTAVTLGDEVQVTRLLQADTGSANARGADGCPTLHMAVNINRTAILTKLIEAGCDLEIRNQSEITGSIDDTALHCAAFWGRVEIAKLLIDAGADVNARDEHQFTPFHEAVSQGSVRVAAILLEHGAQVDAVDDRGPTPLDICPSFGRTLTKSRSCFGSMPATSERVWQVPAAPLSSIYAQPVNLRGAISRKQFRASKPPFDTRNS